MKKTLALGMAAAMTATLLAGCGGSSSSAASSAAASTAESTASSTAAASTAESTGSYTDYSAGFPENVTIQIPVYDRGFENWNPTDNYYTRWIQSEGVSTVAMTNPEVLKAACIIFAAVPIICVYPFIQKYFVQGTMVGAVKG